MKKLLSIAVLLCSIIVLTGCNQQPEQVNSKISNPNDEAKWLLTENEFGEKYPYTVDQLSIYCQKEAVWLEDVEGNKYALNGIAKSFLKGDKKYKGGTDLILKQGMPDLYSPTEALGFCLRIGE